MDLGIATKLLNKIPGPGLGEKRLTVFKEGGTNLSSKTFTGNHLPDKTPEFHFSEFLDGDVSETAFRDLGTRGHSAKLTQSLHSTGDFSPTPRVTTACLVGLLGVRRRRTTGFGAE